MSLTLLLLFRFIAMILFVLFCNGFLDFKKSISKVKIFVIIAASSIVYSVLKDILEWNGFIATFVLQLSIGFILFQNAKIKIGTIISLYIVILTFIELFLALIFENWTNLNISTLNVNAIYYTINYLINIIITILIMRFKKKKRETKSISIYISNIDIYFELYRYRYCFFQKYGT